MTKCGTRYGTKSGYNLSVPRKYEEKYGFLNFELKEMDKAWKIWRMLGEAFGICKQISATPMPPQVAKDLSRFYMIKGVQATTAIEGNPLSEEEVGAVIDGKPSGSPSIEYLEKEVRNVAGLLEEMIARVTEGQTIPLTVQQIKEFNKRILDGTEHEPNAAPGEFRTHSVSVGPYVGVPFEDIEFLLERLLAWTNAILGQNKESKVDYFCNTIVVAIIVHVYMAWIHPFGDGNGRTARMVEAQILVNSGVIATPAMHLLSDHYNLTRDKYRRMFDEARLKKDIKIFILYALEGFVDGLRKQADRIQQSAFGIAWVTYVHEVMQSEGNGPASLRQLELVLGLSSAGKHVSRTDIKLLNPKIAQIYAGKSDKTLSRDISSLLKLGLIIQIAKDKLSANVQIMSGFLPPQLTNYEGLMGLGTQSH